MSPGKPRVPKPRFVGDEWPCTFVVSFDSRFMPVIAKSPPLDENGPTELARAARAFNALSDRIAHFVAERVQILAAISHDLQTPITRMKESRNRETGGTGLGLASAHQLAVAVGGSLKLRNRESGGLVAEIRIP
ncbi:hypothetical protein CBM2634_U10032 [Cupriavidus taiwanensis]|uniref:histidine kinase n=1 Tax=Cupriavidus taiwanensis TaxID=164546 RepID=A0A375JCY0_9BURK|nr:hypothetical protein CBM2634_U10032 [Cupriavidus taiwanensis]